MASFSGPPGTARQPGSLILDVWHPHMFQGRTGAKIVDAARQLGITVTALAGLPKFPVHEKVVPRIAIPHTWIDTPNEGRFRTIPAR